MSPVSCIRRIRVPLLVIPPPPVVWCVGGITYRYANHPNQGTYHALVEYSNEMVSM